MSVVLLSPVLPKPSELIRTAISGAAAVGITGSLSLVVSALSFVDEHAPDPAIHLWADSILKASGVRTVCHGLEHLPAGNFVLCVNHQSNFDALVLFRHIRRHFRYVAKKELLKAQRHRTQERNRADALARLQALVGAAAHVPRARKPTKPTRASQRRRDARLLSGPGESKMKSVVVAAMAVMTSSE